MRGERGSPREDCNLVGIETLSLISEFTNEAMLIGIYFFWSWFVMKLPLVVSFRLFLFLCLASVVFFGAKGEPNSD